jgi:hypothetical protein
VTEVEWESRPVTHTSGQSELEDQVRTGEKVLEKITFDIVVPEEGVKNVEGCYRINSGNWEVYYFTKWHTGTSLTAPIIRSKAIFQSGISGVSGVVPARCFDLKRRASISRCCRSGCRSPSTPFGILSLKNRMLSPLAGLFIACAREVVKPLSRSK